MLLDYASSMFFYIKHSLTDLASKKHGRVQFNTEDFFFFFKKMNMQNKRIQELIDIVKQKDETITRLQSQVTRSEETIKDYVSHRS